MQMDPQQWTDAVRRHIDPAADAIEGGRCCRRCFETDRHAVPALPAPTTRIRPLGGNEKCRPRTISAPSVHSTHSRTRRAESTAVSPARQMAIASSRRFFGVLLTADGLLDGSRGLSTRHGQFVRSQSIIGGARPKSEGCRRSERQSCAGSQPREAANDFVEVARNAHFVILEVAEPCAVPTDGFPQSSSDLAESHAHLIIRRTIVRIFFSGEQPQSWPHVVPSLELDRQGTRRDASLDVTLTIGRSVSIDYRSVGCGDLIERNSGGDAARIAGAVPGRFGRS